MPENADRKLSHQRLSIGRSFAGDDEVGILDKLAEMDGVEQHLYAWPARCMKILHEGIAKTTGGTGS